MICSITIFISSSIKHSIMKFISLFFNASSLFFMLRPSKKKKFLFFLFFVS